LIYQVYYCRCILFIQKDLGAGSGAACNVNGDSHFQAQTGLKWLQEAEAACGKSTRTMAARSPPQATFGLAGRNIF
jgi:hypothetical protein